MANPQLENGFTMIAHEILEALAGIRISGEAWQVLCVIIRKTYGFKKTTDYISLSQFKKHTKISQPNIVRAINKLVSMNVVIKKDNLKRPTYRFNKDYDKWIPLSKKITTSKKVIKKDNQELSLLIHTKDTLTKDTKIIGKSLKVEKQTNAEYGSQIKAIMDSLYKYYHVKPGGGESAKILKTAGDIGYALTSIQKSLSWGDENYLPKILRELKNRGSWPDSFHEQAKAENRKFEEFMKQKFGDKIGDMIAKIGRNVK